MKKTRILWIVIMAIISVVILSGCDFHSSKSYTYDVENGDRITIKMDTSKKYDLTSSLPIKFSKDDEVLSQGTFAKKEAYDTYYNIVENDSSCEIIEEKSNKNGDYFFYTTEDGEYNYIIKIKDSDTCFILGNNVSKSSAKEVFSRLTFEVED